MIFCIEVEDDESNLLNSNAAKVKDQNSHFRSLQKTQSNCNEIVMLVFYIL